jgi:hypothetical protein
MTETLSPGFEHEATPESLESRFGNEELIIESLREGEVRTLGNIDELYPEIISKHRNQVDITEVDLTEKTVDFRNRNQAVAIDYHGQTIQAVFKPFSGEDKEFQENEFHHSYYPREYAAYLISRHFNLDLVPPTTIREVDGKIGALQLFMPPPRYLPENKALNTLTDADFDTLHDSNDMRSLAVLDHILANCDRHNDNYLLQMNDHGGLAGSRPEDRQIVAIDHGMTLDDAYYRKALAYEGGFKGPHIFLTHDNIARRPINTALPDWLQDRIRVGLEHKHLLSDGLAAIESLEASEVDLMWARVEELHKRGIFVSPHNINKK